MFVFPSVPDDVSGFFSEFVGRLLHQSGASGGSGYRAAFLHLCLSLSVFFSCKVIHLHFIIVNVKLKMKSVLERLVQARARRQRLGKEISSCSTVFLTKGITKA